MVRCHQSVFRLSESESESGCRKREQPSGGLNTLEPKEVKTARRTGWAVAESFSPQIDMAPVEIHGKAKCHNASTNAA